MTPKMNHLIPSQSFKKIILISTINMSKKFGVGPCVLAGHEYSQGDSAVYMGSDLQDPPELIPKLMEKFRSGAEIVYYQNRARRKIWI